MQVRHSFTGVRPIIEHQTKTRFGQAQFIGNFGRLEQEMSQDLLVFGFGFVDARNEFFGDDQDMRRRLWFNIVKRQN